MKYNKLVLMLAITVLLGGNAVAFAERGPSVETRSFLGIHLGGGKDDQSDQHENEQGDDHGQSTENEQEDDHGTRGGMFGIKSNTDVKAGVEINSRDRAVAEIDRRVADLTALKTRIDGMKRLPDGSKTSIKASINAQIKVMQDLKVKIQGDTDDATLKADIQSITKSYRIYMLIMPQIAVAATSDRIHTTVDLMTQFGTKLQTRINDAQTAGKDVSAYTAAYSDYKAKIADANIQADAAVSLTANLHPDNGDQATIDANKKAFADARAKIKIARDDLQAARKDAETIVKGLKGLTLSADAKIKADSR